MIPEDLAHDLEEGLSVHLATRDEAMTPEGVRVWAVEVSADRRLVTAFVLESEAAVTLRNLASNGRGALSFGRPSDNHACQLKGRWTGRRPCTEADRDRIDRQVEGYRRHLAAIGISGAISRGWKTWPCVALMFRIEEMYQQTPGPGAGERL